MSPAPLRLRWVSAVSTIAAAALLVIGSVQAHAQDVRDQQAWDARAVKIASFTAAVASEQDWVEQQRTAGNLAQTRAWRLEHLQILAGRDALVGTAREEVKSSQGKADEHLRDQVSSAADALAAAAPVHSVIVSASVVVNDLVAQLQADVQEWDAQQAAAAAAARTQSSRRASTSAGTGVAPASTAAHGGSVREVGEAVLRSLPGSDGVTIHWDDPDLSGHLGAVWAGNTSYIMVNGTKLAGNASKTGDVVRHELAHIFQGRLMTSAGMTWGELGSAMSSAFGENAQEKSADCVALRLGATWTHYTSACGSPAQQAWVDGLLGGYVPAL